MKKCFLRFSPLYKSEMRLHIGLKPIVVAVQSAWYDLSFRSFSPSIFTGYGVNGHTQ